MWGEIYMYIKLNIHETPLMFNYSGFSYKVVRNSTDVEVQWRTAALYLITECPACVHWLLLLPLVLALLLARCMLVSTSRVWITSLSKGACSVSSLHSSTQWASTHSSHLLLTSTWKMLAPEQASPLFCSFMFSFSPAEACGDLVLAILQSCDV